MNLILTGDHIALDFPYDAQQVAEIKTIPGAQWDKLSKTWRTPLASIAETLTFANKHGFTIDPNLKTLDLPKRREHHGLTAKGRSLTLDFPYDPVKVKAVKQIPGARWDSKNKVWKTPRSSLDYALSFAETFSLTAPQNLTEEAKEQGQQRAGLYDLSSQTRLDEPLNIPELALDLYPFQHVGVQYALETRRTFIADAMGIGKTAQAIAALAAGDGMPAVIVAPPSLVLNWVYELRQWLPNRRVVACFGKAKKELTTVVEAGLFDHVEAVQEWEEILSGKSGINPKERFVRLNAKDDARRVSKYLFTADVIVLGYAVLEAWEPALSRVVRSVVFDESQYIKTTGAKRTKAAKKLAKNVDEGMVLLLTGTPVSSRPAEFAAQLDVMDRIGEFGGVWGFYKRYCAAFRDRFGQWHVDGKSNTEELNRRLRSSCFVRRLKSDVLPDLAEKRSVPFWVDGDPKVMKEYARAEADIVSYMQERARELAEELGEDPRSAIVRAKFKAQAAEHIVRLSALRQIAARAKREAVVELVNGHIEEGSKVVVAAHHRDIVSGLAEEWGGYKIIGGQPVDEVELFKDRFQRLPVEQVPVIVLSQQAAKAGHTLTAAQDILMVELPWTPADFDQTVDRLHRIGQEGSVLATSVLVPGTIDEVMWDLLAKKRKVVDAVTDGTPMGEQGSLLGDLVVRYAGL